MTRIYAEEEMKEIFRILHLMKNDDIILNGSQFKG